MVFLRVLGGFFFFVLHHYSFNPAGLSSGQWGSQREVWSAVDRVPHCLHLSPKRANRRGPTFLIGILGAEGLLKTETGTQALTLLCLPVKI
ncbi:hypothetical protein LEMLEM_LOCUS23781, partial [Lemmus lemmus]